MIRLEFFDVLRVPARQHDGVNELEILDDELIDRFVRKAKVKPTRSQHQNQFRGFETENESSSSGDDEDHQPRKRDQKESGNSNNQEYKKGPGGAGGDKPAAEGY